MTLQTKSASENDLGLPIVLNPLLPLLSFLYSRIIILRNFAFRNGFFPIRRLNCPVISIGNLTVGGTGKTPFLITLGLFLKEKGYSIVVLSRGYKRQKSEQFILSIDETVQLNPDLVKRTGDEPLLIAKKIQKLTLGISSNRYETGCEAIINQEKPIVLLDDGYQHQQLKRDLNILLIDVSQPLLEGEVLPAGRLREPLTEIRRADAIVLTRTAGADSKKDRLLSHLQKNYSYLPIFEANPYYDSLFKFHDRKNITPEHLTGRRILIVSGVGNPGSVEQSIVNLGLKVVDHIVFRDHHRYTSKDLEAIRKHMRDIEAEIVITTEKDALKLALVENHYIRDISIYVLSISMEIDKPHIFFEWIIKHIHHSDSSQGNDQK